MSVLVRGACVAGVKRGRGNLGVAPKSPLPLPLLMSAMPANVRKKHILIGCKLDMFWHQTFEVWMAVVELICET